MIKHYEFDYDFGEADASFDVDTEKFTPEIAQEILDFWTWEYGYDKEADPIDEAMKKMAMEVIQVATENHYNTSGVKQEFENREGWIKLDGSLGVTLKYVGHLEFDETDLEMKVVTDPPKKSES